MTARSAFAEDRPSERLRLGHLVGSLRNRVLLQETHRCVFIVSDLRALSEPPVDIRGLSREIVLDWMSAGLVPERSTFALQSLVPEIGELALLLAAPDAADLLLFRADEVPVAADRVAKVASARELARRFNLTFGPVFAEPRAVVGPALDIPVRLSDTPREVEWRVRTLAWSELVSAYALIDPDEVDGLRPGDVEPRIRLARMINEVLEPLRERRRRAEGVDVEELLREGSRRARELAGPLLEEVRVRARLLPAARRRSGRA